MAKFVGKTLESLNYMLNNSGLFSNTPDKSSAKFISWYLDSESFARKLKYANSKQAEEDIIQAYLGAIQKRLSEPNVSTGEMQEMIKLCMSCETIGYSTSFIYVHCLKLAQKGNLKEKHTGYLASAFFLHPHHELVILLINTIQKDLCSSNYMEILFALSAICNLINSETVHNVLSLVEDRVKHDKSSVRKSAILTLGHCLQLTNSQSAYQLCFPKLEKALTDRDLEVVSASVCTMNKMLQKIPGDYAYLIDSLLELQDQILLRRVPGSMIYCDIPAPWLQLDILKLLKTLCKTQDHAQQVIPILKKTLQQVGLQTALSHAIIYQVIETIICLQPSEELVETVLTSTSIFLKSKHVNLKLIGVESLILVVKKLKPSIAAAQQEIVMECLKLNDETLQLKTLELLYYLANPSNVQAICNKIMEFLGTCTSEEKQKDLSIKVLQLAAKFIDKQEWFVSITLSVLLKTGNILSQLEISNIIDNMTKDDALKEIARTSCLNLCKDHPQLPSSIIKLTASVLIASSDFEEILPKLLIECSQDDEIWLIVSLTYVVLKTKKISPNFVTFLRKLEMKEECAIEAKHQLLQIIDQIADLGQFNLIEKVDPSLTFLDDFVVDALEKRESCYLPHSFRLASSSIDQSILDFKSVNSIVECSEISFAKDSTSSPSHNSPSYSVFSSPSTSFKSLCNDKEGSISLESKTKIVWTEEGRKDIVGSKSSCVDEKDTKKLNNEADRELLGLFAGLS